jgi:hypothetical protein
MEGRLENAPTHAGLRGKILSSLVIQNTHFLHSHIQATCFVGGGGAVCRADNLTTYMRRMSRILGASTSWSPKSCNGIALPSYFHLALGLPLGCFWCKLAWHIFLHHPSAVAVPNTTTGRSKIPSTVTLQILIMLQYIPQHSNLTNTDHVTVHTSAQ